MIRQPQIENFRQAAQRAFAGQIAEHLRSHHEDLAVELPAGIELLADVCKAGEEESGQLPDETFESLIVKGITKATAYGLTWRSAITAFVSLMFVVAPNFDEHPAIRDILLAEEMPPDERIEQLFSRVPDSVWEEAASRYDAGAWRE